MMLGPPQCVDRRSALGKHCQKAAGSGEAGSRVGQLQLHHLGAPVVLLA